jgi:hypothetical protein
MPSADDPYMFESEHRAVRDDDGRVACSCSCASRLRIFRTTKDLLRLAVGLENK